MTERTMMAARILRVVVGVTGAGTVILGLLFWFAGVDLIGVHMTLGITFAAAILALSAIALTRRPARTLGAIGCLYALVLPLFGLTQTRLLVGSSHWVVQVAHLLVGLGAMALAQAMHGRMRGRVKPSAVPA